MTRTFLRHALGFVAGAVFAAFATTPVMAASITLNDSNCDSFSLTGTAPNQTLTCVVSNAPSGCSITGPSTGSVGTPITLTAVCASGSPNAWAWSGGSCAGMTTQSCAANDPLGQVGYSVIPRNNIGAGNTATSR